MNEDYRLRQVADLLVYCPAEGVRLCPVEREVWTRAQRHRDKLRENVLEATRLLFEYDRDVLSRLSPTGPSTQSNLSEAIRAAAAHVHSDGDWFALLMLLHEHGVDISAGELSLAIGRLLPDCRRPSRQGIDQGWWDTERRCSPPRSGTASYRTMLNFAILRNYDRKN